MKKLSKIIESIWSDIQDRSSGEIGRKEDDVNLLDPDDFIAHIRKNYRIDNTPYDIENRTMSSTIFIPICSCGVKMIKLMAIYFKYDEGVVYTHKSIKKYIPKLWAKLDQEFDLWDDDPDYQFYTIINPKDTSRKITNSYVLEVLNFMIDNIDDDVDNDTVKLCLFRRTNESIWSDIQDRSSGDVIRKEDEVNHLDKEDFCDYLKENYKMLNSPYDIIVDKVYDGVCVNIYRFLRDGRYSYLILKDFSGKKSIELTDLYNKHMSDLLFGAYKVTMNSEDNYIIESYDGREITNTFYIEVLDFLLKNADHTHNPCVKKIGDVKESIWSDIQDRSAGEVVRKEDEFSSICEFIKDHYFVGFVGMDDIEYKDDYIHVPIYKVVGLNAFSSVEIHKDNITFASIDPNKYNSQTLRKFVTSIKDDINQLFDKIKDTYSPEISTFDGMDHWVDFEIKPKDGKITPKFCEEVIDFILDNTTDDNNKILKILEKTHNCLNV